ncbi:MAG: hypothetical protein JNG83_12195 [Opitutaceae bacterium]|nr:hypothetical protein [Opitutaceae bacterium]
MKTFLKVFSILALVAVALIGGLVALGHFMDGREARLEVETAAAALLRNDPGAALVSLHRAAELRPDDAAIARLYQEAQVKWLESIDQQIADMTPAQRFALFDSYPMPAQRKCLAEPYASAHQRFIDRNAEETQAQVRGVFERAMDFVAAGNFAAADREVKALQVGALIPGVPDLWQIYDSAYATQLLFRAGDLAQNEQIDAARRMLESLKKRPKVTPEELAEATFRIDLGEFCLRLNQAVIAAAKEDPRTAEARIQEARPILGRLLGHPALAQLFPDLPAAERGTPLINQLDQTLFVIHQVIAAPPAR